MNLLYNSLYNSLYKYLIAHNYLMDAGLLLLIKVKAEHISRLQSVIIQITF